MKEEFYRVFWEGPDKRRYVTTETKCLKPETDGVKYTFSIAASTLQEAEELEVSGLQEKWLQGEDIDAKASAYFAVRKVSNEKDIKEIAEELYCSFCGSNVVRLHHVEKQPGLREMELCDVCRKNVPETILAGNTEEGVQPIARLICRLYNYYLRTKGA